MYFTTDLDCSYGLTLHDDKSNKSLEMGWSVKLIGLCDVGFVSNMEFSNVIYTYMIYILHINLN